MLRPFTGFVIETVFNAYKRMRKPIMVRKSLLALFLLLIATSAIQAQRVGSLVIFANGQLWALEAGAEQPQPVDFCMPPEREPIQGDLVISPDGTKITFRAQPEIVTAAVERSGGIGGGELPSNIWLCDLQAQTLTAVAGQPEGASFFAEDGTPDSITVHGLPAWSPDGTALAWTQYLSFDQPMQLVTHDLATGERRVIVPELPPQYGVPTTINLQWGGAGIALISYAATEANQPLVSVNVYDPETGGLVRQLEFPEGYGMGAGEGVSGAYWVSDDMLGIVFTDGHFEAFAPEIGVSERVDALELYSTSAASDGLSLMYGPFHPGNIWAARDGDSYTALAPTQLYQLSHLAISPAGDAVAYVDVDNQVYIWNGQMAAPVSMTEPIAQFSTVSLVWSPLGWRDYRGELPELGITGESITCLGFMESRLVVGQRGIVSDDLANNLREQPTSSSARLGEIPSGGEFNVLAGPMCAQELAWWQVDYNGVIGWTAEGQGDEYWLAPLP